MEVDYGTFMKMIEEKDIGRVQIENLGLFLPIKRILRFIKPER